MLAFIEVFSFASVIQVGHLVCVPPVLQATMAHDCSPAQISIMLSRVHSIERRLCLPDEWLIEACSPAGQSRSIAVSVCDNLRRMASVCVDVEQLLPRCNATSSPT